MNDAPEKWVEEERTDVCSYAHDAVETLLKENMRLKEEILEVKHELKRLLWIMEEHD